MSTNRSRRIDQDTAEQLLGGAVVGTSAGQAPLAGHTDLAGLLAAAAAPAAGDGALPGEEAALTAFREARRNPAPEPRRRTMASTAPARAFSVKALSAAFAITALGGVAVAAGTGSLPAALGGSPNPDTSAAAHAPAGSLSTATAPPGRPGGSTGSGATSGPGYAGTVPASLLGPGRSSAGSSRPGDPRGSDSPGGPDRPGGTGKATRPTDDQAFSQLVKLCKTYSDREAAGGKSRLLLADPQLAPLIKAAGGADGVDGFCTAAIARSKEGDPTTTPSTEPTRGGQPKPTLGAPTGKQTAPSDPTGGGAAR